MTTFPASRDRPPVSRNVLIAGTVVLLHVGGLYALQTGLLRRAVEVVVPVELLSAMIEPPKVQAPPPAPVPRPVEPKPEKPVVRKTAPTAPPAPRPVAINDPTPAPNAPTGITEPQPPTPPISAPVAAVPAPAPAPAPAPTAKVELPSTDADYLHNPAPPYPRTSFKLGEEGTTTVRVLVGPDGKAQDAQVAKSSGFPRLDQAALETALRSWRYVPGKRGGVAEAMWVNVPIKWEITK
jgi:protein TonB